MPQNIVLTVDYHDQNCVIRRFTTKTAEECVLSVPTTAAALSRVVAQAQAEVGRKGRVIWVQESTTGWARVKDLLGDKVDFHLANVLQMPLPPKARRRKTDKIDTARIQREFLNGSLPLAHQPPAEWRSIRRLVGYRENLVARQTALRNWISRYLAHETWAERTNLWSVPGRQRLQSIVATLPQRDALVLKSKLQELDQLQQTLQEVLQELLLVYNESADAQRVDAVRGIGFVAAMSIVARIGPIERFRDAEQLIAYAGLAPGLHESDGTRRNGHIGGGGTDKYLRHYLIEASIWARQIERYRGTYERTVQRRGKKVGRIVVARLLLRSIFKVLRDGVAFEAARVGVAQN